MKPAKGRILEDNTYQYTCGQCSGAGFFANNDDCPYCYGLDYDKLLVAFKTARGGRYYAILKAILSIKGKQIAGRAIEMRSETGMSLASLLYLMMEFHWPRNRFSPLAEWLEECRIVKTGSANRIKRAKLTIKDALEQLGHGDYDND